MANAGVVGMAEVVVPSSSPANSRLSGSPAMWSFIWTGLAVVFLLFIHLSVAGRR